MKKILTLLTILIALQSVCSAQSKSEALDAFDEDLAYHLGLYNGREYDYRLLKNSNPFFLKDTWSTGQVTINDQTFKDVSLIFDIEQEVLVIRKETEDLNAAIQLDINNVQQFIIANSLFSPGSINGDQTYLELLFQGKNISYHNAYKKRKKVSAQTSQIFYEQSVKSYIKDSNGYQPLSRTKKILKIFPALKADVKNYVKSNRLSFKDEADFLTILLFIDDQLK